MYFREYNKSLDILNSPVIEVIKTIIKGQKILRRRIWVSDIFYKTNIGKLGYCKKYMDMYQTLCKWVKKMYLLQIGGNRIHNVRRK